MEGDGSGFAFPTDFTKQDAADPISWGDFFMDSILSDDTGPVDSGVMGDGGLESAAHHLVQQSQKAQLGGQLQIQFSQQNVGTQQIIPESPTNIPTHIQVSQTNNVQQSSVANLGNSVAYLASSQQQQINQHQGRIQSVLASNQQHPTVAVSQANPKLVQIAPSIPVATVQQLQNSVPLQTLIQPSQTLGGQTIYNNQNSGLFPPPGSVHIENPKVVNVNFGPHVIQPDASSQQAILQGKRVLITNSPLQQLPQSISLTQMGTQLINPAGNNVSNVIRATVGQGASSFVQSSTANTRQILLPTGQTVVPRQSNAQPTGFSKNVVLRQLNSGVQPVIVNNYQGQSNVAGQLIQPQHTLIASSGAGLQVVNTGSNQQNQVQLIAQPSINQGNVAPQQSTLMNLLPNTGNQISGLVPGQSIFVNGQMINISQLAAQLQVQPNAQGTVTVANINSGNRNSTQIQSQSQLVIHPQTGQQIMMQTKNSPSPSLCGNNVLGQQRLQNKIARTPTPNANSASSTPVPTPTPSTPTPASTPDLIPDMCGKVNILDEALKISQIDLEASFKDDRIGFLGSTHNDPIPSSTPPPPVTSFAKAKSQPSAPKSKKASKAKPKPVQPTVNVTVNNNLQLPRTVSQPQNSSGRKLTISPHQKIITDNGQVLVVPASAQSFVLPQSSTSMSSSHSGVQVKTAIVQPNIIQDQGSTMVSTGRPNINIQASGQSHLKLQPNHQISHLASSQVTTGQLKLGEQTIPVSISKNPLQTSSPSSFQSCPINMKSQLLDDLSLAATSTSTTISSAAIPSPALQVRTHKISTLPCKIIKQEPQTSTIKQEPVVDIKPQLTLLEQNLSSLPTSLCMTSTHVTANTPQATSSCMPVTTTTQSHLSTIMSPVQISSSQSSSSLQTSWSGNSNHGVAVQPALSSSPALPLCSTPSTVPALTAAANVRSHSGSAPKASASTTKSMMQIKVGGTVLSLKLTPSEKEKLEEQLPRMTIQEQKQFVNHQQELIRPTQKKQTKHQKMHQPLQITPPPESTIMTSSTDQSKSIGTVTAAGISNLPVSVQELMETPPKKQKTEDDSFSTPVISETTQKPSQPVSQASYQQSNQSTHQPQAPASHPFLFGHCLGNRASQQLNRDCCLAVVPDVNTPFTSFSDAMRRLVRYHTLQDHKPTEGSKEMVEWDAKFGEVCENLVKRKRFYLKRFTKRMFHYDMCPEKWPDNLQNLKCFNENLRESIDREKEEARNHPETFATLHPAMFNSSHQTGSEQEDHEEESEQESEQEQDVGESESEEEDYGISLQDRLNKHSEDEVIKYNIKKEIKEEPPDPISNCSHRKRKHEEPKSSGTLKIVIQRKTTDNFIVKNSIDSKCAEGMKPVVKMDLSDSVYEYDSKPPAAVNQPVTVRRRNSSVSSWKHPANDDKSECDSEYSYSEHNKDISMEEDDSYAVSENGDKEYGAGVAYSSEADEESVDEGEMECKAENGTRNERSSQRGFFVSFEDDISEVEKTAQSQMSFPSNDTYKESNTNIQNGPPPTTSLHSSNDSKSRVVDPRYSDISVAETNSRSSKKSISPLRPYLLSVASDEVFSYPIDSRSDADIPEENCDVKRTQSFEEADPFTALKSFQPFSPTSMVQRQDSSSSTKQQTPQSPLCSLEGEPSDLLPNASIFTTPNKSLLQIDDAMFNTSSDEDDDNGDKGRPNSTFEIDNKDPQSSMTNDSVRIAIDKFINDEEEEPPNNWGRSSAKYTT